MIYFTIWLLVLTCTEQLTAVYGGILCKNYNDSITAPPILSTTHMGSCQCSLNLATQGILKIYEYNYNKSNCPPGDNSGGVEILYRKKDNSQVFYVISPGSVNDTNIEGTHFTIQLNKTKCQRSIEIFFQVSNNNTIIQVQCSASDYGQQSNSSSITNAPLTHSTAITSTTISQQTHRQSSTTKNTTVSLNTTTELPTTSTELPDSTTTVNTTSIESSTSDKNNNNVALVASLVVAGIVGVALIMVLVCIIKKRTHKPAHTFREYNIQRYDDIALDHFDDKAEKGHPTTVIVDSQYSIVQDVKPRPDSHISSRPDSGLYSTVESSDDEKPVINGNGYINTAFQGDALYSVPRVTYDTPSPAKPATLHKIPENDQNEKPVNIEPSVQKIEDLNARPDTLRKNRVNSSNNDGIPTAGIVRQMSLNFEKKSQEAAPSHQNKAVTRADIHSTPTNSITESPTPSRTVSMKSKTSSDNISIVIIEQ